MNGGLKVLCLIPCGRGLCFFFFFEAHVLWPPSSGSLNHCFLKVFSMELLISIHRNESSIQCQEPLKRQQKFESVYIPAHVRN